MLYCSCFMMLITLGHSYHNSHSGSDALRTKAPRQMLPVKFSQKQNAPCQNALHQNVKKNASKRKCYLEKINVLTKSMIGKSRA